MKAPIHCAPLMLALALAAASNAWAAPGKDATPVALTVKVSNTSGCGRADGLDITQEGVRRRATEALVAKGYRVVSDHRQSPIGLEAYISVSYCENVTAGAVTGISATTSLYGLADGSSKAVPSLKRVPFNWSTNTSAFGGDSANDQAGKVRRGVLSGIDGWIDSTF